MHLNNIQLTDEEIRDIIASLNYASDPNKRSLVDSQDQREVERAEIALAVFEDQVNSILNR